ncbi:MAG: ABC transporter permease [Gammaproteobacteria bacterium]|nr:MAG: ABC transporter permease [Gammaproteobacteria bacterium]
MTSRAFHLAKVFLRMFLRDRQAMFLSLLFPVIFMSVLVFMNRDGDPIEINVANQSRSEIAAEFVKALDENPLFEVIKGEEEALKKKLTEGDATLVLVIPKQFDDAANATELGVFVDAAEVRLLGLIMPTLEKALLAIERKLRHTEPMFSLRVEDVQSRSQGPLDFLLPGILAFTLMQISIAGSGFNIVEYRRKGILKRLFVTPIKPSEFIAAICMARLVWCLLQLTALLGFAVFLLDVNIRGSFASLYLLIVLGTIIFLCIGFAVGSLAKTQQAVGAIGSLVIFPQVFLAGVFIPIELLPEIIQPVSQLLPLTPVVNSMREITNNGASLVEIMPTLFGVGVWIVISFAVATRLFVWKEVVN